MIGRLIGTHPCQDHTNIAHRDVKTFTKFIVIVWLHTVGDESINGTVFSYIFITE